MDRRDEVLAIARRLVGPCDVVADRSWADLGLSIVLEVMTADGTSLIVKSHNDVFRNQLEAAAYRNWVASIADRAPALVGEDEGSQVLVLTKLDGRAPSGELPPSVYADAGAVLRQFHGSGEELVDPGWAAQRLSNLDSWIERMPPGLVDPEDVKWVREQAARLLDLPPPPLVPCHGDFQPRNWLVDRDGRVLVFDFEKARHDWWIHDIQRMWWKEWAGRPDLRDHFLAGYGRQLDETEVAGFRANSARGHLIQIIWATQHRDLTFADEGRTYLARMRTPTSS
jgi:Ser/Thr protein kinase RdoA (MazF antagonist)